MVLPPPLSSDSPVRGSGCSFNTGPTWGKRVFYHALLLGPALMIVAVYRSVVAGGGDAPVCVAVTAD